MERSCDPPVPSPICLQDVADNQINSGDLMDCLVQNKHQKEMNDKCAVGVTHFQLVSERSRACHERVCCCC